MRPVSDGAPQGLFARAVVPWLILASVTLAVRGAEGVSPEGLSAEEMLRAADATRRAVEEGSIRIRSTVGIPGEAPVVSLLEVLVSGEDRVLCIFREGPLQGRRILMAGGRVWLLVPGTSRPVPVSANQRLLGGASIADVARLRLAAEFSPTLRAEVETLEGTACRVIDLKAKVPKASYAAGTLWVGVADGLPRQARFTLRSGKEAKVVRYTQYGRAGGRTVLKRMDILHRLPSERGMTTTLDFLDHEARTLDPRAFDPAGARDVP